MPVIATVKDPVDAVLDAVTVSVEPLPPAVTEVGLRAAVNPAFDGEIEADRPTVPGLPEITLVLIVDEADAPPCTTISDVGAALMEKSLVVGAATAMLPSPVGPSQPGPAVHNTDGLQLPLEPEVTS